MTKSNKVLEALERIRKRIKTEVDYWKRADGGEIYEATEVNKILREEINKAVLEKEEDNEGRN